MNSATRQWITLRWLLRVAFGRWSIESCFRQSKEELGLDHYEVRGWRCLHRHFYATQLSHLIVACEQMDELVRQHVSYGDPQPSVVAEITRGSDVMAKAPRSDLRKLSRTDYLAAQKFLLGLKLEVSA